MAVSYVCKRCLIVAAVIYQNGKFRKKELIQFITNLYKGAYKESWLTKKHGFGIFFFFFLSGKFFLPGKLFFSNFFEILLMADEKHLVG